MSNRLQLIPSFGQSIWYDNIQHSMLVNGDFDLMIKNDDLRGVTSNPSIFDKAISGGNDYDNIILKGIESGLDPENIFWDIAISEISDCCDIFKSVYDKTDGVDGYVSLEVSPFLAKDTTTTVKQAKEIYQKVNRPNLMVKVPATKEGLPAITELIADGISINVTLIFSVERYREVADAYIAGLERAIVAGKEIKTIQSVASFFVSRLDSSVDKILEEKVKEVADEKDKEDIKALFGKAAIANSKIAYKAFQEIFTSDRFKALELKGGNVQRPLWASTSTKNPEYRDVLYVEELIGPNTVNTVPPATLDAFRDHGEAADRIALGVEEAQDVLNKLQKFGVDIRVVTEQLEDSGVKSFSQSFEQLLDHLKEKSEKLAVK